MEEGTLLLFVAPVSVFPAIPDSNSVFFIFSVFFFFSSVRLQPASQKPVELEAFLELRAGRGPPLRASLQLRGAFFFQVQ